MSILVITLSASAPVAFDSLNFKCIKRIFSQKQMRVYEDDLGGLRAFMVLETEYLTRK
jgi:hypothetical protein